MENLNLIPSRTLSDDGDREPPCRYLGKQPMEVVDIFRSNSSRNISNVVQSVGLEDPVENFADHGGNGDNNRDEADFQPANASSLYQAYVWENSWPNVEQPH